MVRVCHRMERMVAFLCSEWLEQQSLSMPTQQGWLEQSLELDGRQRLSQVQRAQTSRRSSLLVDPIAFAFGLSTYQVAPY